MKRRCILEFEDADTLDYDLALRSRALYNAISDILFRVKTDYPPGVIPPEAMTYIRIINEDVQAVLSEHGIADLF